jgi:hypothetical protein
MARLRMPQPSTSIAYAILPQQTKEGGCDALDHPSVSFEKWARMDSLGLDPAS